MRALAWLALLPALGSGVAQESPAIEREWWVRAAARAPASHADELASALADARWRHRASALDALARAAAAGAELPLELVHAPSRALDDPHPSVRARALEALAALGEPLSEDTLATLAVEPLPSVRLALARALARVPAPGRALALVELAHDEDPRVQSAARQALLALEPDEPGVGAARCAVFLALAREGDVPALARFAHGLVRAPLLEDGVADLRRASEGQEPLTCAMVEVLGFARFDAGDAPRLARGWCSLTSFEPAVVALFAEAANARSESLARALIEALGAGRVGAELRPATLELCLESLGPGALDFLVREAPATELTAELLAALGQRRDAWALDDCASWLAPDAPRSVRRALLDAVAGGYTRAGAESNAGVLARFLDDPEVELAARAFEILCETRGPSAATDQALHEAYARLTPVERARRLAWFTRSARFPSFLADWIAIGTAERAVRGLACELLAPFEGEVRAREALEGWIDADLARLTVGLEREDEQLLQAELRALARVDATATAVFVRALEGSLGTSVEVGKVAVAALGRSPSGRARLAQALTEGALAAPADRRTRMEACIVLAREGAESVQDRAVALLLAERSAATWELRGRMLRALEDSGRARAHEALEALVLAPNLEPVERVALVEALAGRDDPPPIASLRAVAGGAFELEPRSLALAALGERGDRAGLCALREALEHEGGPGESESRALLRGELWLALARLDPPPPGLCEAWLQAPLQAARADLARRYDEQDLPAPEFTWRHELALARRVAGRADVLSGLDALPFERIDGRTLAALGESLEAGGDPVTADRFLAAGDIALAGEPKPELARVGEACAHRLALAWRAQRWELAARMAERLLALRRARAMTESQWALFFGSAAREDGVAPDARVRAALWQARARAFLAERQLERARDAVRRAASECARSRLAASEQRELEHDLTQLERGDATGH